MSDYPGKEIWIKAVSGERREGAVLGEYCLPQDMKLLQNIFDTYSPILLDNTGMLDQEGKRIYFGDRVVYRDGSIWEIIEDRTWEGIDQKCVFVPVKAEGVPRIRNEVYVGMKRPIGTFMNKQTMPKVCGHKYQELLETLKHSDKIRNK